MAPALGKRKRVAKELPEKRSKVSEEVESESDGEELDAQEIFRRHFEAQFKPLPEVKKATKAVEPVVELDDEDDEEGSDWDGISGREGILSIYYY